MKTNKSDLLFYYVQRLEILSPKEVSTMLQHGVDIETYLSRKNLPEQQMLKIKFMLLKHFLIITAEKDGFLNRDQVIHLINHKIWELKEQQPPYPMLSLKLGIIPANYFGEIVAKLNIQGIFSLADVSKLVSVKYLLLPDEHSQMLKKIIAESQKNLIKKDILHEEDEVVIRYKIKCLCGNTTVIETEVESKVRLYCSNCNELILDLRRRLTSGGKSLGEVAPELMNKINWEKKAQMFANYELLSKLGEGASGKVYLARKQGSDEHVALKVLHQTDKSENIDYFMREIRILKELKHPNIVGLKDWGTYEDKPYLAMEYIEGFTLHDYIQKKQPYHQVLKIIAYVLKGLTYAHGQNLVHRDIKPANIFISENGQVKLIDMGIAKITEDSLGLTQSGQLMGTPYYLAPEQIGNFKHVTHQADIYSVGATLFHCLCGVPPFFEYNTSTLAILMNKSRNNYIHLQQRNPRLPDQLYKIVVKAMAHQLEMRYKSASEMRDDIIKFQQINSTGG